MASIERATTTSWMLPFCSALSIGTAAHTSGASSSARVPTGSPMDRPTTTTATSTISAFSTNHTKRKARNSGASSRSARGSSRNGGGYS